ncbi:MAG TPA: helix-turn-helix domain-containing protein [Gemmatimonadaceae bacterium]|nr:helix-turn-helix domain-containing protein [Gemmatimonadaceae bacterium]
MNTLAGFKGLRRDLLVALRKEQPLAAKELGVRFGLTANALRRHLKELEDAGLVRFRREVRGVGGPVYAYSLTDRGEQLFPREYAGALADALELLRAEQGTEGVVRLFRRRWDAVADEARPRLETLPLAERAHALAAVLTANGYMAEAESRAPGEARIREHNCAVREIAQRFPEVCSAEAAFIEEVLGAVVERQQHMMSGCKSCEYTATEAPATATQAAQAAQAAPVAITRGSARAPLPAARAGSERR